MSYFTVMVIGNDPEKQLAPFDEELDVEFIDETQEYKNQYETETADEFYCESNSSWGYPLSEGIFNEIKRNGVGSLTEMVVSDKGFVYLKNKSKYRGYFTDKDRNRSEDSVWFEVYKVVETTHPNADICFTGKVIVKAIDAPKKIPLKQMYLSYDMYLSDWHGIDDLSVQGYWINPNAKWDWYSLGGRWSGMIKLKKGAQGMAGESGVFGNTVGIDQAQVKDISNLSEIKTFAVLKDGKWYEKGEMGWWGIVSNEKDQEEWDSEIEKLLNSLSGDTLISIYDCHI